MKKNETGLQHKTDEEGFRNIVEDNQEPPKYFAMMKTYKVDRPLLTEVPKLKKTGLYRAFIHFVAKGIKLVDAETKQIFQMVSSQEA
jgi:hydroxyacylglutathione hydrolase